MTLPLALRDGLAALILDALHEREARRALAILADTSPDGAAAVGEADLPLPFPREWFETRGGRLTLRDDWTGSLSELTERAGRARRAIEPRSVRPRAGLPGAMAEAGMLFDAGLYFEVHELLEPHWMAAGGDARRILQGLIQVAVGFQHLANGNARGGIALLREGAAKLESQRLLSLDLGPFADAVRACAARGGASAPPFPAAG